MLKTLSLGDRIFFMFVDFMRSYRLFNLMAVSTFKRSKEFLFVETGSSENRFDVKRRKSLFTKTANKSLAA